TVIRLQDLLYIEFSYPSAEANGTVPWIQLSEHPRDYYDTALFHFPLTLNAPEAMDSLGVLTLVSYFTNHSLDQPFHFYSKDTIIQNINNRLQTEERIKTTGDDMEVDNPEVSQPLYPQMHF